MPDSLKSTTPGELPTGSPSSPTPPRHRRALMVTAASVGAAALIAVGALGASAAVTGATNNPTLTAAAVSTSTAAPGSGAHAGLHRAGALRRELTTDIRSGSDFATRAQKIATTLVGSPKVFAALPANLQTDLTSLKNASGTDIATDATNLKNTALSGGYGADVQKVAERIQTRITAHASSTGASSATPTPRS